MSDQQGGEPLLDLGGEQKSHIIEPNPLICKHNPVVHCFKCISPQDDIKFIFPDEMSSQETTKRAMRSVNWKTFDGQSSLF